MNTKLPRAFSEVSLLRSVSLHTFLIACLWTGFFVSGYAQFSASVSRGVLDSGEIREASGLVASLNHPGYFWTHNDSGDEARIFLIDSLARHRGTWYLEGVKARDWEEIGRLRRDGVDYLIVGDIGDNRAQRAFVTLHIFPEPELSPVPIFTGNVAASSIQTLHMRFEDGPRDAEAFFYDARDRLLYVVTKRELQSRVYTVSLPEAGIVQSEAGALRILPSATGGIAQDTLLLQYRMELPMTWVTAADLSPAGDGILIKNLLQVFYWQRQAGETVLHALQRPGLELPYQPEPQGEAITFAADGMGYYTLSESVLGLPVYLNFAEKGIFQ